MELLMPIHPQKILHVFKLFYPHDGGIGSCVTELVQALNKVGDTADALTLAPRDPAATAICGKAPFYLVPDDTFCRDISRNFHRELRERFNHYDLYHIHGLWQFTGYDTICFCRRQHLPYIVTLHGMLYPYALSIRKNAKKILRKLFFDTALQNAACIHVTCEEELKHYRELGLTNPVAIIPHGIAVPENIAQFRAARNRVKRIVFLGRLHPIKNLELLLQAWAHTPLAQTGEFILAGDGEARYRQHLQALCRSLNLHNVVFTGWVDDDAKLQLIADARAVISASKMENFGMTIAEALMVGTPALTGDRTPWNALPLHHCGWHVATDEAALIHAFSEILSLPEAEIQAMGDAGIRYFDDHFSASAAAQKMSALYAWLLHQGKQPDFVNMNERNGC